MDTNHEHALALLGVSQETQHRLEVMGSVPAPDESEYDIPDTVTVTLPIGQVQNLRAALRSAAFGVIKDTTQALALMALMGKDVPSDEDLTKTPSGRTFEALLSEACNAEDALAAAYAGWQADKVEFAVPDSLPDDFESWDE